MENVADAITLTTNGGTTEQIVITNTQGTAEAGINLVSTAGGITMSTGKDINLTMPAHITDGKEGFGE